MLSSAATVCLGFILCCIFKLIIQFLKLHLALRVVPGPPPSSLFWGEEWLLYHDLPGSAYLRWHRQFGKIVKFSGAFGHKVLSITDSRAIAFIISEEVYSFPKPNGVRAWFKATLGEGILWTEGKAAHEKQRRTLAPALSQHSVRNLTHICYETSSKLAAQWSKLFDMNHAEELEIEITNWAGRFALDTIGRAAFSYDFDCLSGQRHALAEVLDGLTNNENKLSSFYIRALFWIFPGILWIGKKGKMIRSTKRELGEIALKMWKDAKTAGDSEGRTLMSIMLNAAASSGQCMSEQHVVAQMRTIISAGYEPVSAVVAWMFYELSKNPQIQSELREEILSARDASFDELNNKYPLLDAVVKETLRLHPPVLENHHEAGTSISIPLSEPIPGTTTVQLTVPKGTTIVIPLNVIQTDPEIWGNDAQIFRPQRWIQRKKSGRELLAFSEGPRSCIGKAFALTEVKALAVTILQQFAFSCPYDIEPFQSFVVRPRIKGQGSSSLPLVVTRI